MITTGEHTQANEARAMIYPALSYRDAAAAIAWLTEAFGFAVLLAVPGSDGTIGHAELRLGDGVIMLGNAQEARGWLSPLDLPGASQTIYVYVADLDAHHARAVAAGATITQPLHDTDYGSREYAATDLEGHRWSFGTYRPSL
ncbi:MAG TPA: VOC family protein [Thermomicrobiales bacterium]|jgi:uncharacterized glyoxalase superfamily protein PhnB